jgi:hypothetical protein
MHVSLIWFLFAGSSLNGLTALFDVTDRPPWLKAIVVKFALVAHLSRSRQPRQLQDALSDVRLPDPCSRATRIPNAACNDDDEASGASERAAVKSPARLHVPKACASPPSSSSRPKSPCMVLAESSSLPKPLPLSQERSHSVQLSSNGRNKRAKKLRRRQQLSDSARDFVPAVFSAALAGSPASTSALAPAAACTHHSVSSLGAHSDGEQQNSQAALMTCAGTTGAHLRPQQPLQ